MEDEYGPVEVYSGSPWEAELVKSILEDSGIETFLKDEITGTLAPWYVSPGGAGPVKVTVAFQDLNKATLIVEAFEENLKKGQPRGTDDI